MRSTTSSMGAKARHMSENVNYTSSKTEKKNNNFLKHHSGKRSNSANLFIFIFRVYCLTFFDQEPDFDPLVLVKLRQNHPLGPLESKEQEDVVKSARTYSTLNFRSFQISSVFRGKRLKILKILLHLLSCGSVFEDRHIFM